MRGLLLFVTFLSFVLILSFAFLNSQPVTLNFFLRKFTFPLALILAITLSSGIVIGWLVGLISCWRQKQVKRTEQQKY